MMTLKITKQRQEILDIINASDGHMTADQIHAALRDQGVSIGIATVYRSLNVLYAEKFINRVRHPELGYIYDKNVHEHYHFRCIQCNKIQDVDTLEHQDALHALVEKELGCVVMNHDITFEGLCQECLKKKK